MPKTGSGKTRIEEILMDVIASHSELVADVDVLQELAAIDTAKDLQDDAVYAKAHKRVEIMLDLPDCQLRGHLNLLERELDAAIRLDLEHTAGDAVRRHLPALRCKVNSVAERARSLMGQLKGGHDA